ncbi:iron-hydroxamate ABC transporter substrate-binding protein [Paenibacillus arenilitoris]|uniref:Iron-hydroxamate ABC transporter substrate-binding protein n=1 Tax=Paenibacillus arenilitoris TaxID=2772299 RepID=A0A927CML7_9BACL|nr:iron-hydroxamate ABC transporter substrate-binding protein [Paenibacillus arenilitoris]MBD2870339.1 iron-hydroxamate ABC transporter substrate-binding protein [Paenibacillus arenilitoris]
MKNKLFVVISLLLMVVVSACGGNAANNNSAGGNASSPSPEASAPAQSEEPSGTVTYDSENGPIEIPANPTRIVALTNAPNVLSLGVSLIGVDEWTGKNPLFTEKVAGVEIVGEADLEKISALEPDLIIAGSHMQTIEELKKIAPTVVYTWGKLDYLTQQVEIGKLLNKEEEAQAWVDDFKQRAEAVGKEIKAKHGEDVTVTVFETDSKNFYVFGDKWARGTEILYQAMGLGMPEKVTADALEAGYYTLSQEVIPDYSGDFIVISRAKGGDNSFMDTELWKNVPAVKAGQVIEIDTEASTYSDPITLDYLLDIFKKGFLGEA